MARGCSRFEGAFPFLRVLPCYETNLYGRGRMTNNPSRTLACAQQHKDTHLQHLELLLANLLGRARAQGELSKLDRVWRVHLLGLGRYEQCRGADQLELAPLDALDGMKVAAHVVDGHVVRLGLEIVLVAHLQVPKYFVNVKWKGVRDVCAEISLSSSLPSLSFLFACPLIPFYPELLAYLVLIFIELRKRRDGICLPKRICTPLPNSVLTRALMLGY